MTDPRRFDPTDPDQLLAAVAEVLHHEDPVPPQILADARAAFQRPTITGLGGSPVPPGSALPPVPPATAGCADGTGAQPLSAATDSEGTSNKPLQRGGRVGAAGTSDPLTTSGRAPVGAAARPFKQPGGGVDPPAPSPGHQTAGADRAVASAAPAPFLRAIRNAIRAVLGALHLT